MMPDWVSQLSDSERDDWDKIVTHAREQTFTSMSKSAFVMHLIPEAGKLDIKFCVELGMAIMLGKPIMVVAVKGVPVSPKLREIADELVELAGDLDTETNRAEVTAAIRRMTGKLDS